MPREPKCLVCGEPATKIAVDQLRAQGSSIRDIAEKVGRSSSSVGRHVLHSKEPAGKKLANSKARSNRAESAQTGRCPTCKQIVGESDQMLAPPEIVKRAERVLFISEGIAAQAQAGEDLRLCLNAVDRCQRSIDTLARISGLLQPDSSTTVNIAIDNRRKSEALLAQLTIEELRSLAEGKPLALPATIEGEIIDAKAQPTENGTAIRDQEGPDNA